MAEMSRFFNTVLILRLGGITGLSAKSIHESGFIFGRKSGDGF